MDLIGPHHVRALAEFRQWQVVVVAGTVALSDMLRADAAVDGRDGEMRDKSDTDPWSGSPRTWPDHLGTNGPPLN